MDGFLKWVGIVVFAVAALYGILTYFEVPLYTHGTLHGSPAAWNGRAAPNADNAPGFRVIH